MASALEPDRNLLESIRRFGHQIRQLCADVEDDADDDDDLLPRFLCQLEEAAEGLISDLDDIAPPPVMISFDWVMEKLRERVVELEEQAVAVEDQVHAMRLGRAAWELGEFGTRIRHLVAREVEAKNG